MDERIRQAGNSFQLDFAVKDIAGQVNGVNSMVQPGPARHLRGADPPGVRAGRLTGPGRGQSSMTDLMVGDRLADRTFGDQFSQAL
jgi:hypothetical protein